MSDILKDFTDAGFQSDVLDSDKPVLVDFWAEWCGPCKALTPTIEAVASENDGWVVGKMDIQKHPQSAAKYGIRSIPALLFFKGGEVRGSLVGAVNKDKIVDKMKEVAG